MSSTTYARIWRKLRDPYGTSLRPSPCSFVQHSAVSYEAGESESSISNFPHLVRHWDVPNCSRLDVFVLYFKLLYSTMYSFGDNVQCTLSSKEYVYPR